MSGEKCSFKLKAKMEQILNMNINDATAMLSLHGDVGDGVPILQFGSTPISIRLPFQRVQIANN